MTKEEARKIIEEKKQELGKGLIILGHHYQSDEVIASADFVGDSLELARKASQVEEAGHIVFCGVFFMAESAAILARISPCTSLISPPAVPWPTWRSRAPFRRRGR